MTISIDSVGWSRAAIRTASGTTAFRSRWTKFVHRQFAITVFVERFQRVRGVGDFVCINHTVVIGIERGDDRRWWWMMSGAAGCARALPAGERGRNRGKEPPVPSLHDSLFAEALPLVIEQFGSDVTVYPEHGQPVVLSAVVSPVR